MGPVRVVTQPEGRGGPPQEGVVGRHLARHQLRAALRALVVLLDEGELRADVEDELAGVVRPGVRLLALLEGPDAGPGEVGEAGVVHGVAAGPAAVDGLQRRPGALLAVGRATYTILAILTDGAGL